MNVQIAYNMLYLIYNRKENICKIGYSSDAEKRLSTLQVSNHELLELLFTKEGGKKEEFELHKKYNEQLVKGEWFNYIPEMSIEFIGYEADLNESYYYTFVSYLDLICKLNSFTEVKVLVRLCEIAEFNSGKVSLTAGKRTEFIESLSINKAYLSSSIKSLINKGLLKGDKGEYQINPLVFWKGSLKERNALIKENGGVMNVKIDFNCPDCI